MLSARVNLNLQFSISARLHRLFTYPFSRYGLMIAPTVRKIIERGTNRSVATVSRLGHPEITELFPRFHARKATSTTCADVCDARAGGRFIREASKKPVSVTPGHSAITLIPYGRFSSQSASEKESTNALVAA